MGRTLAFMLLAAALVACGGGAVERPLPPEKVSRVLRELREGGRAAANWC